MTEAQNLIAQHDVISQFDDEQRAVISELMESYAALQSREQSNLLRSVLEDAGIRLQKGAAPIEIAQQLIDAAEASLEDLLDQNVEIEIDEEIGDSPSRPQVHGDPVLASLYHATRLRDGIAAIQIAGETPSEDRKAEFRKSLEALRDTLNSHL